MFSYIQSPGFLDPLLLASVHCFVSFIAFFSGGEWDNSYIFAMCEGTI